MPRQTNDLLRDDHHPHYNLEGFPRAFEVILEPCVDFGSSHYLQVVSSRL
jgi:hypothetical protein